VNPNYKLIKIKSIIKITIIKVILIKIIIVLNNQNLKALFKTKI
jgi:hypothetical protein